VPLIYTAASQSLAVLEILVHLEAPELLQKYAILEARIEESLITDVDNFRLPEDWVSPVIRVPSAIVTSEYNFLLNPLHRSFLRIKIPAPSSFQFDSRLLKSHGRGLSYN
jgi:RES domain-containing protein